MISLIGGLISLISGLICGLIGLISGLIFTNTNTATPTNPIELRNGGGIPEIGGAAAGAESVLSIFYVLIYVYIPML